MNYWDIKFNHGVEVGAYLAYLGHYRVTKNYKILMISNDELHHRATLEAILRSFNHSPSKVIDIFFTLVGWTVYWLCQISPSFMMDKIACMLEIFAFYNYKQLAQKYPEYKEVFMSMAENEKQHEDFFKGVKCPI